MTKPKGLWETLIGSDQPQYRTIQKAFVLHPNEATIIGRLLAGYSELEFSLLVCLVAALNSDTPTAFKIMFRLRGESSRIDIADAIMHSRYKDAGLSSEYAEAIGAIRFCKDVRNQYAHAHWQGDMLGGLHFFDLENAAKQNTGGSIKSKYVDVPLLTAQETYFC